MGYLRLTLLFSFCALAACGNPFGEKTSRIEESYVTPDPVTDCKGPHVSAAAPMFLPDGYCFRDRASAATYTDVNGVLQTAAASVPRTDYDPVTHALNGILVEPAATNIVLNSNDFMNAAYWTVNGAPVFALDTPAPDGTTAVSFTSSTSFSGRFKSLSCTASTTYTMSLYFKYISGAVTTRFGFAGAFVDVNSQLGTVTFSSGVVGTPSITPVGNGWFRGVLSVTTGAATTTAAAIVYNRLVAATKIAYWGAQVERGTAATSYIPTSTGAASRAADTYSQP